MVIEDSNAENGASVAVALLLGRKLFAAASQGTTCVVAEPKDRDSAVLVGSVSSDTAKINVSCIELSGAPSLCLLLFTEAVTDIMVRAAVSQLSRNRPRAAANALLCVSSSDTTQLSQVSKAAACAQLAWADKPHHTGPATKRQKTDGAPDSKVRCRQILLKYTGCRQPKDHVRKRPVRRTLAEAESALHAVLVEIDAGGDAVFTQQCRGLSECSSSLKGGDLAGDVGWLVKPVERPGERLSKQAASRNAVVRAAFELEVGEISDILVSEDGAHILQRIA